MLGLSRTAGSDCSQLISETREAEKKDGKNTVSDDDRKTKMSLD